MHMNALSLFSDFDANALLRIPVQSKLRFVILVDNQRCVAEYPAIFCQLEDFLGFGLG